MLGLPISNGYLLAFHPDDLPPLRPYLDYTTWTLQNLVAGPPLSPRVSTSIQFLEHLTHAISLRAGTLSPRGRNIFHNRQVEPFENQLAHLGPIPDDSYHTIGYVILSSEGVQHIRSLYERYPFSDLFTRLDSRVRDRGQSSRYIPTVCRILHGITSRTEVSFSNTPNPASPRIRSLLLTHPWEATVPRLFPTLGDLGPWNARVETILTAFGSPSRRSTIRRILSVRSI